MQVDFLWQCWGGVCFIFGRISRTPRGFYIFLGGGVYIRGGGFYRVPARAFHYRNPETVKAIGGVFFAWFCALNLDHPLPVYQFPPSVFLSKHLFFILSVDSCLAARRGRSCCTTKCNPPTRPRRAPNGSIWICRKKPSWLSWFIFPNLSLFDLRRCAFFFWKIGGFFWSFVFLLIVLTTHPRMDLSRKKVQWHQVRSFSSPPSDSMPLWFDGGNPGSLRWGNGLCFSVFTSVTFRLHSLSWIEGGGG